MAIDDGFELRVHPNHLKTFRYLCGVGVIVCLIAMALGSHTLAVILFFATATVGAIMRAILIRTCRCPQCKTVLKRDKKAGPCGCPRFTCPSCRVVWQSLNRAEGR
jgi:hypothetical protein